MKFAEFDVLAKCNSLSEEVTLEVRVKHGPTYHINFNQYEGEARSSAVAEYILPDPQLHLCFPKIDESTLKNHERFARVKHFYFGKFKVDLGRARLVLEVEYIDTTNGQVPLHKHSDGIREVYLNLEAPYDARTCGYCQEHETFCKHTLAIKVALER